MRAGREGLIHDARPTACIYDAAFAYVDTHAEHANIGFFFGVSLPDPAGIVTGAGKRMRHVKLSPGPTSNDAAIGGLITAAYQDMRRRLPVARTDVARLRRFLDNLLDMARIDSGALVLNVEAIDVTDAVASAVHDLRELLGSRKIDLRVPPTLPLVKADPVLLHHILINLLANAAIHGGDGPIEIIGRRGAETVSLAVRDHGRGLKPGTEMEIFENFTRGLGGDQEGGSGLGLAIAKSFATALGIEITAENAANLTLSSGRQMLPARWRGLGWTISHAISRSYREVLRCATCSTGCARSPAWGSRRWRG